MAAVLHADGRREALDVPGLTGEQLQAIVGGWFEFVYLGSPTDTPKHRTVLIVNEDGHALGLPLNPTATALYRGTPPRHDGVIVGPAILAVLLDPGGDTERII